MNRLKEIMRRQVVTLHQDTVLDIVRDIMDYGHIRHLPVLENGRLVGLISWRDLLGATVKALAGGDAALARFRVGDIMVRDVVAAGPDTPVAEAVALMLERKIGCLPVVDDAGLLVGLVTRSDLLRHSLRTS